MFVFVLYLRTVLYLNDLLCFLNTVRNECYDIESKKSATNMKDPRNVGVRYLIIAYKCRSV